MRSLGANWRSRDAGSANKREAPSSSRNGPDLDPVLNETKQQILPLDGGYFRSQETLSKASGILSDLWNDEACRSAERAKVRETEALIATVAKRPPRRRNSTPSRFSGVRSSKTLSLTAE
ncbi:hypothetical protein [Rhizobium esperanzae]|uniref:Uncharacterized protein n=1 Tax=Rhizobium esperanzae TaxID=1967781 RepID=A0A7W6W2T6_9HYPH|nr:hypothetical protein [Rhizobium esperanzae]MBB4233744.1 hypothetical protein [Rhizobium esperanzae]